MKLGIIGVGCIGSAIKSGFEHIGHEVKIHDVKLKTSIDNNLPFIDSIYVIMN